MFGGEVEPLDNLDSPPKAKRKSRPPRRHKPHYDPRDENGQQQEGGADSAGPSGLQSSSSSLLDFSGKHNCLFEASYVRPNIFIQRKSSTDVLI